MNPSNMQHSGLMYQMRKSRGINWTHDEKLFLVNLCSKRARIIEEKKSDSYTLRMKAACWKVIYDQFSARFGRKRTLVRIKEQWKRMKLATRAEQRDREQERLDSSTGSGSTNPQEPAKYYGETPDIIAQVKKILNDVASSNNSNPIHFNNLSDRETNAIIDDISRLSEHRIEEQQSNAGLPVPDDEQTVIKIEIDDEDEMQSYHDNIDNTEIPITSPQLLTTVVDFNSIQEVENDQQCNSESSSEHRHSHASNLSHIPTDDVQQFRFSTDMTSNTSHSTPEASKSLYDPEHSSERWGNFRKTKPDVQQNYEDNANVSRSDVNSMVLEYARIEHEKKMEYLKKEHEIKMEILIMERETARAKLRKANFKLSLTGANVPL